jgi:hypothetical protein
MAEFTIPLLGMFALKKIPFNQLNMNTILSLSIIISWFLNELKDAPFISNLPKVLKNNLSYEFLKELFITKSLYLKSGVESSIVIYKVDPLNEELSLFISEQVRGIDIVESVDCGISKLILILLPLSSIPDARGFVNRIEKELSQNLGEIKLTHRILRIDSKVDEKLSSILEFEKSRLKEEI